MSLTPSKFGHVSIKLTYLSRDAFSKREKANEDKYVKEQEMAK